MSTTFAGCLSLMAMLGVACAHSGPAADSQNLNHPIDRDIWWAPSLGLTSLTAVDERLRQNFAEPIDVVRVTSGSQLPERQVITSCRAYFNLKGYEPVTENDSAALKVEGAKCHAIEALDTVRPASRKVPFTFAPGALEELPAGLSPAPNPADVDLRATATKKGTSWHGYDESASLIITDASRAKVVARDSVSKIEILGRADFDGDGIEDVMLLIISQGTEGSWRDVRLCVVTRAAQADVLRVIKELPV